MTTVLLVALLIVSSHCPNGIDQNKSAASVRDTREEAERLWELAIAAKGGRERLHAVNNLQVSIRDKQWYHFKRVPYIHEALYVFPGKFWEWNDLSKTVLGFRLRMYNHDRDTSVNGRGSLTYLYDIQLRYFMETKWVRPIPLSAYKAKLDGKSIDIVETVVKGYPTKDGTVEKRIAFALDQKTHLPLRVIYRIDTARKEYSGGIALSDYEEVAGIQVPSKVYGLKTNYQINVDYDEQLFTREPKVEAGIKQWMKK